MLVDGPVHVTRPRVRRRPVDQIAIDASTRLIIAISEPQPGNRNDTIVYRTRRRGAWEGRYSCHQ
ncbi:hypothetical protein U2F26_12475 [Micromonospora sp. 4G57]|uniref:Transposase n=1 Tax=Micromonospora sicca TaxID=2202420 RepID=A0ABU5J8S4_9ACTN|nr:MULTISPECIES: hypothetical protein [unclassified Micromonospora]MDZ5443545.1 hypothetical protein [Micromonospora sp. 4G57]MDZ5488982.1 hypothetical protein [Micromonospora sp. 4G53]